MDSRILDIEGWMSDIELEWLNHVSSIIPEGDLIVEIGAWMGRSSAAIFTGGQSKHPILTIDTWKGSPGEYPEGTAHPPDIFGIFLKNMFQLDIEVNPFTNYERLENKNYFLEGDSLEVASSFPDESIKWLFYDGRHMTTGENLDVWLPKMKSDGLLTGHDYFCFHEYIQQEIHKRFFIHQIIHSIWVKFMDNTLPVWYK